MQITGESRSQETADVANGKRWVESKKWIQGRQKQVVGTGEVVHGEMPAGKCSQGRGPLIRCQSVAISAGRRVAFQGKE